VTEKGGKDVSLRDAYVPRPSIVDRDDWSLYDLRRRRSVCQAKRSQTFCIYIADALFRYDTIPQSIAEENIAKYRAYGLISRSFPAGLKLTLIMLKFESLAILEPRAISVPSEHGTRTGGASDVNSANGRMQERVLRSLCVPVERETVRLGSGKNFATGKTCGSTKDVAWENVRPQRRRTPIRNVFEDEEPAAFEIERRDSRILINKMLSSAERRARDRLVQPG